MNGKVYALTTNKFEKVRNDAMVNEFRWEIPLWFLMGSLKRGRGLQRGNAY